MTHTTAAQVVTVDVEYEAFIARLAKDKDTRTISNSSPSHALSILRNVFRSAQEYVKLFSGSLSTNVYNDETLIHEMKKFVNDRSGKVSVLVQSPDRLNQDAENEFLAQLLTLKSTERVEVKEVLEENILKDADVHFLVSDDRIYRIEVDIVKNTAVGSFNDNQRAVQLRDIFDKAIKDNARLYEPVPQPALA